MKYALVGAILLGSVTSASAVSLDYYGQYYTKASGSGPAYVSGFRSGDYVFPMGYNEGMRIELSFEFDQPLVANTELDLVTSDFVSYSFSDGLYERTREDPGFIELYFYGSLQTDKFGHVSAWDINISNGSAFDSDFFGTSSNSGDYARHSREYETYGNDGSLYVSGVYSQASVSAPGVWLYDESPAIVPLPASLPLVLSGIGLLGLVRRRNRRN